MLYNREKTLDQLTKPARRPHYNTTTDIIKDEVQWRELATIDGLPAMVEAAMT